jgi:transglutaminase-like putative cysteine protease
MLLHVVHETRYRYAPPVENAQHVVHLRPAATPSQQLLSHSLRIEPPPSHVREGSDAFGNGQTFFSLRASHADLRVVADSLVQTQPSAQGHGTEGGPWSLPWEEARARFRYQAGAPWQPASEFLFASHYAPRDAAFVDFARPSFAAGRPLLQAAQDLTERIHRTLRYQSHSTDANTVALDALRQGRGVCQDFAHIMVACCRSLGLPARYVSGYLLTQPPPGTPRLVGSDASHAWASVYSPDAGPGATGGSWFDFDPTNNRAPGEDYVTLATGRDFLDVSPLRGVIRGGARHRLSVAVTVEPLQPEALPATAPAAP